MASPENCDAQKKKAREKSFLDLVPFTSGVITGELTFQ